MAYFIINTSIGYIIQFWRISVHLLKVIMKISIYNRYIEIKTIIRSAPMGLEINFFPSGDIALQSEKDLADHTFTFHEQPLCE